jgi:hypothetical protein
MMSECYVHRGRNRLGLGCKQGCPPVFREQYQEKFRVQVGVRCEFHPQKS